MPPPGAHLAWEALDLWPNLDADGVCGKMVDLVKANPGYEHVAKVLLGDVVVVENLGRAREIWKTNGHLKTLVTLSGEVLDPVGVLTGGSHEGKAAGMLAQKREIKELTDGVKALEAKVELADERHKQIAERVEGAQSTLAKLSDDRHKEELSIVNLERDLRRFEEELAPVDAVIDLIGNVSDDTATRSLKVLRPGGIIVNAPTGSWPTLAEDCEAAGVRGTGYRVSPNGATLAVISRLLDSGDVRVAVEQVFDLAEAPAAHRQIESGHTRGKIVLHVAEN